MQPLPSRPIIQPLLPHIAKFQPGTVSGNQMQQVKQYRLSMSVPRQQTFAQTPMQPVKYPVQQQQHPVVRALVPLPPIEYTFHTPNRDI